ncbi:MAG: MFS transporter, partial [Alphaproteobacteria bacterium]|nr:MFS transporter [Alphaproteobacteria bacterium]
LGLGGGLLAMLGLNYDFIPLLGGGAFVASCGTVLFAIVASALVPELASPDRLPRANARIELARALAGLLAPPLVGLAASLWSPALGLAFAMAALLLALLALARLPRQPAPVVERARGGSLAALAEGAGFVLRQPWLRALAACAILWNFAFFVLVAVFVPFALQRLGLTPLQTGLAQSAQGFGMLLAALLAGRIVGLTRPNVLLLFGPAVSCLAAALLLAAPAGAAAILAPASWFLLGFGPMLWLICQTSLRQLLTPRGLQGRVNGSIQLAIYGVRPLGALAGGFVAARFGSEAALALAGLCFLASFLVPLTSGLRRLHSLPAPHAAAA